MIDIEKVKNLLIKLDLKYKATKDQTNTNGIILLLNFDKEYKEFNTVNALDVLNKLENQLCITEKALKLACRYINCIDVDGFKCNSEKNCIDCHNKYHSEKHLSNYFKQQAKEMLENE